MKYFAICCFVFVLLNFVYGDITDAQFGYSGSFGFKALADDVGASSIYGNGGRDSRQDRGPVLFPSAPSNMPVESSGVRIGASGYGFIPPQNKY